MDGLLIGSGSLIPQPDAYSEVLDCDLNFTSRGTEESDTWYASSGTTTEYYLNGDSARTDDTLADSSEAWLQTIVESDSAETIKFYWKVSSESGGDYLQFYIDSTLKDQISGEVGWQQKSYPVLAGTHTLKWRYVKNGSVSSGENRAWVDFVQWTGPSPAQDPSNWQQIAYKHDVGGRRVEKKVDGYSTRYVYDGPHVIAEYDGNNNLLRKYIYGPGIDQPVCMIEVADANAVYYYHFDALGSVVALSDAAGDTVQTYEYSVYGEVAVEDANHPNPYMFAGVRYDIEIGLYYNRARYYNPYTGRFLQTDPIGYGDGMNWYAYCRNNPLNYRDPGGLAAEDLIEAVEVITSGVSDAVSDIVEGVINGVGRAAGAVAAVMEQIQADIDSHQEVLFYVIGQDGIRIPVKAFESRNKDSGIPFLAGYAMNIGGEIHIGWDMAYELMQNQNIRDAQGKDLEALGTPITDAQNWPRFTSDPEEVMAHEIGHQIDADKLGLFYLVVGAVCTHNREGDFERNASCLGEYYGIDWNYTPPK